MRVTFSERAKRASVAMALCVVASVAAQPGQAGSLSATAGVYTDDHSGLSYDLDAFARFGESWSASLGAGRSEQGSSRDAFSGTSLRGAAGWQGSRLGLRLNARDWSDSSGLDTQSLGAEVSLSFDAGFRLTAIAQQRDLGFDYTVFTLTGRSAPARAAFSATGFGAELAWSNERWLLGLRAIGADYGSQLDLLRAASLSSRTLEIPRLNSLLESMRSRAFIATDRETSLSIDRSFARAGLRLDANDTRDALSGESSRSVSLAWRYRLTPRLEGEIAVGAADDSLQQRSSFGGLSLTIRR